jgi:hypothetical protein
MAALQLSVRDKGQAGQEAFPQANSQAVRRGAGMDIREKLAPSQDFPHDVFGHAHTYRSSYNLQFGLRLPCSSLSFEQQQSRTTAGLAKWVIVNLSNYASPVNRRTLNVSRLII